MSLQLGRTDTAGEAAPPGSASRSPLTLFIMLCLVFAVMVHAEPLAAAAAAAADLYLQPDVVAGFVLSVAALVNLVILKLNFLLARRPAAAGPTTPPAPIASASRSPVALFMVLCLLMGAALHAEQLSAAAAAEYQIHPSVVVGFVLAASALFHLAILCIHKSLARHHQAEDEPKQLRRPRGRVPLLPFVILALVIPTAASAEKVLAADAADLPQEASVWALLALAVSFNIAIGSLYCFIIAGPPPPAPTGAEPLSWSKASGAIISFIVAATAVLVLYMLLASGGASGAIAARS
ncbi:unnamed protein product [Urochloa decumbens]|uniref:Uncharacterized protein n=1 Tax=Urochloa decumbens TaxID=240449 RepID=A0ABC9FFH3_9POAL